MPATIKTTIAAGAVAAMVTASPLGFAPTATAGPGIFLQPNAPSPAVHLAKSKKGYRKSKGGGGHHKDYRGHWRGGCYNCGGWDNDWVGPVLGLGAGIIIGSLLVPRYYAVPRASARIAYCKRKFRSYDVRTRTYLGYDGRRHYC